MKTIFDKIRAAAEKGQFEVSMEINNFDHVRKLMEQEFTVTKTDNIFTISWKD